MLYTIKNSDTFIEIYRYKNINTNYNNNLEYYLKSFECFDITIFNIHNELIDKVNIRFCDAISIFIYNDNFNIYISPPILKGTNIHFKLTTKKYFLKYNLTYDKFIEIENIDSNYKEI